MGKPAARITDAHACPIHGRNSITAGSPDVFTNKLNSARVTDGEACGSAIVAGSAGVFINGLPAARLTDPTNHGGAIASGSPDVFIGEIGSASAAAPASASASQADSPSLMDTVSESVGAHEMLDAAGMIPVVGIFADLANAVFYAIEGDGLNAGFSLAACLPIFGQAATAAKYANKAVDAVGAGAKAKAKQEAAEAAAPPSSKPPKKDKDPEEAKEGEGKDGGYVEGGGKFNDPELEKGYQKYVSRKKI
ncbi:PAAR domain-containing protein [Marinomonas gallaica]|uniref:PAAR domain-containing protein n=1 Tax=Marinomonas gallaica TaxID=1806667 RepID=UPI003CE548A6